MSSIAGPLITNNGLVFGYDTGYGISNNANTTRYNLGEPTTNLLSESTRNFTDGWGWSGGASSTDSILLSETFNGASIYRLGDVNTPDPDIYTDRYKMIAALNNLIEGDWYVFSFDFRVIQKSNVLTTGTANNSAWVWYTSELSGIVNFANYDINKWYRAEIRSQIDIDLTAIPRIDWDNSIIDVSNLCFEKNSHTTPYTPTSRSTTESLLDLTGNSTIDLNNVSFDTNSQMYFDGIDDYTATNLDLSWNDTNSVTLELIIKKQSSTTRNPFIGTQGYEWQLRQSNTNLEFIYWNNVGGHTNGPTPTLVDFFNANIIHLIMIWNHIDNKYYFLRNGELFSTINWVDASINKSTTQTVNVGGNIYKHSATTSFWNGEIPILKIYNRTLTQTEITNHYNSYKHRFNL